MAKIVDDRGNEFKVGCVFGVGLDKGEVLKVLDGNVLYYNKENNYYSKIDADYLQKNARILHYKELAPDKNNFMLCEGDMVLGGWQGNTTKVIAFFNGYFILENLLNAATMEGVKQDKVTFVSRPIDLPAKSAEAIKLGQLIKDAEEAKQKLDEALKKARG